MEMEAGSNSPQFDVYLGGENVFRSVINVKDFCKNRLEEILMLTEALKESPFRGQAFQRLPMHMRRRQMSHYIKRLPRRLRTSFFSSAKEEPPPPLKRPSRKYRRRPKNLLLEYNRRQRDHVWLETHIWHAKRFHMTSKWGYRLPEKSCNKSFRACYRAAAQHCFLHDMSYYGVLELRGSEERLLQGLQQCVSPDCGLTFAAKMYRTGSRMGSLTLYHPNSFPYEAVGHVSFMWKPSEGDDADRVLWMLLHPALHEEVVDLLLELFGLSPVESPETLPPPERQPVKLSGRNIPFRRTPKYAADGVAMAVLKDTVNVFRLAGPLSPAVLANAFDVFAGSATSLKRTYAESFEGEQREAKEETSPWWRKFYKSRTRKEWLEAQGRFYGDLATLTSPAELPPSTVTSLVITDPRLTIPAKRTKAVPRPQGIARIPCESLDRNLCRSPLWCPEVRDEVAEVKMSTAEINAIRTKLIVPGEDVRQLVAEEKQARIPLLLLHRIGQRESGFGSGFDVIVPGGWAMPVWLSLVYRGARTAGLLESEALALEGSDLREALQPDSRAGEADNRDRYRKLRTSYFKKPPNKRANYAKLGTESPFYIPWRTLIRDWRLYPETPSGAPDPGERFFVLRDAKKLSRLRDAHKTSDFRFEPEDCLVPVVVECDGKGSPEDFAMICLPAAGDGKRGNAEEEAHADDNAFERKSERSQHGKLLKSMRRKRRKKRKQKTENGGGGDGDDDDGHAKASEEFNRRMEALWLGEPEDLKSVVHSCSRTIIGYVVRGGYSYSRAQGCGLGYVALKGFLQLAKRPERGKEFVVLVRNPGCATYRRGKLKVCAC